MPVKKWTLGEDVYIWPDKHKIYKISESMYWVVEYYCINFITNHWDWFEEWQITKNKINIWFNKNDK